MVKISYLYFLIFGHRSITLHMPDAEFNLNRIFFRKIRPTKVCMAPIFCQKNQGRKVGNIFLFVKYIFALCGWFESTYHKFTSYFKAKQNYL